MKWDLVERVAKRMAGRYPLEGTYHETKLARQAPEMVRRASEMVEAETGLVAPGQPAVAVVSRNEWVKNNLASFSLLLEPIEQRLHLRILRTRCREDWCQAWVADQLPKDAAVGVADSQGLPQ